MKSRGKLVAALAGVAIATLANGAVAIAATVNVYPGDRSPDADGCGGGPGPAADPCDTLQAGVDTAAAADTVRLHMDSGAFLGAFGSAIVGKPGLKIVGPMEGISPAAGRFDSSLEASVGTLTVTAPDVIVDGLRVGTVDVQADRARIQFNIVVGDPGVALTGSGHRIHRNRFEQNYPAGVSATTAVSDVEITRNYFTATFDAAIRLAGSEPKTKLLIASNRLFSTDIGMSLSRLVDSTVRDNTITESGEVGIAIGGADGVSLVGNLVWSSRLGLRIGLLPGETVVDPNLALSVHGNNFLQGGRLSSLGHTGIEVDARAVAGTLKIAGNRFVRTAVGSAGAGVGYSGGTADPLLDIEDNWWGCNEGPISPACDSATGPVDTDPWLQLSLVASPAALPAPGPTSLKADVTANSAGQPAPAGARLGGAIVYFEKRSGSGSVGDSAVLLSAGAGETILSSPVAGRTTAIAALDNATATASVDFGPPLPAPSPGPALTAAPSALAPDTSPPKLEKVRMSRVRVRRGVPFAFHFQLSEAAIYEIRIERCTQRPRCRSGTLAKTLKGNAGVGPVSARFSGRVRGRALRRGRYRALIQAIDAAGNRSQDVRLTFRVR